MRQTNVHQYYVYILTNTWKNVLYTGVTNSLETRVWQHKNKANQAIARETQIKSWRRAKKDALIATMNPEWNDLAADWYGNDTAEGIPRRLRGSE